MVIAGSPFLVAGFQTTQARACECKSGYAAQTGQHFSSISDCDQTVSVRIRDRYPHRLVGYLF
jgi:hypothetical protein